MDETARTEPTTATATPDVPPDQGDSGRLSRSLPAVAVVAVILGALTSVGQTVLPDQARSLANSSGSWVSVAFAAALLVAGPPRPRRSSPAAVAEAALAGAIALWGLLAGYVVTAHLRDYPMSSFYLMFWTVAGALVGPIVGIAAAWVRGAVAWRAGLGAGVVGGVVLGEAAYGLTVVAATTSPVYWVVQAAAGLGLLVVVARRRDRSATGAALATAAVVASAFVAGYGLL